MLLDALHDDVPQRSRLCIAVPVRDTYPSGCDGSRTRRNSWLSQWTNSNTSCDSLPGYRLGNHARGGRTPFADAGSAGFGVAQTPTANEKLP